MLQQVGLPVARCVTLEQAKAHLRVDHDLEDADILDKLDAAIAAAADYAGRAFNQAQYRLTLDCWPCYRVISIPIAPVVTVATVKYLDEDGAQVTVDAGDWYWTPTAAGADVHFLNA